MKKLILALAATAVVLPTLPAAAQYVTPHQARKIDRKIEKQEARRDWRESKRWDYNHPDPAVGYYDPGLYYRDDPSYSVRNLGRDDRVYAGRDGRYYCRRSDGTTGLIVGGIGGAAIGGALAGRHDAPLGALLGAVGGAAIGSAVDRGNVQCR